MPAEQTSATSDQNAQQAESSPFTPPQISLPKGGGAIRGIGEKFQTNAATGTGKLTVPLSVSPGRSGFGPDLLLSYDSGSGNGVFGIGWSLALPSVTRKTDKGLPKYRRRELQECDVFILSGAEDLVPVLIQDETGGWVSDEQEIDSYRVKRYRPRIEGLFARIERWMTQNESRRFAPNRSANFLRSELRYGKTSGAMPIGRSRPFSRRRT